MNATSEFALHQKRHALCSPKTYLLIQKRMPILEIQTQKSLWTVTKRFYTVEMFLGLADEDAVLLVACHA